MAPRCVVLAVSLAVVAPAALAQGVVHDKSEIRFVSKQMGANAEGRFRKWTAEVDLAKSRADFDIELASIDLASEEVEKEVRRREWFDTARHPVATFRSALVKDLGGDRFEVGGTLTLKGVAREVTVPVALRKDGAGNTTAEGQFTIKRSAFGIGEGPWADPSLVADDVTVRVRMVLR